jgi:hypothetical protein
VPNPRSALRATVIVLPGVPEPLWRILSPSSSLQDAVIPARVPGSSTAPSSAANVKPAHRARPLHKAEGAFLLCGFWMALVKHANRDAVPGPAGDLSRGAARERG